MRLSKIIYTAGAAALATLASCTSALDMAPDGYISIPEIFEDNDYTAAYLNSCYEYIPEGGTKFFYYCRGPVVWSDEAWDSDENAITGPFYRGQTSASYHPIVNASASGGNGDYWTRYWAAIRKCSVFLSYIDNAKVTSSTDKLRWKAEAHVLRAYYYSELLRWYGTGLPIIRQAYSLDANFGAVEKPSFYQTARFVLEDCDAALAIAELPWRITTSAEAARMTKAVAEAIRSRMALYMASPLYADDENRWEEAYEITKQAVTHLKSNGYELYTKLNYPEVYSSSRPEACFPNDYAALYNEYFTSTMDYAPTPADRETIYQNKTDQGAIHDIDGISMNGMKAGTCPSQELVDSYETIDGVPVLDLANPYRNAEQHLEPNFDPRNTLYDDQNPYANRDPRFYATVYYNGSKRYCYWRVAEDPKCYENYPAEAGTRYRVIATYPEEPYTGLSSTSSRTRTGYFERKFLHPNAGPGYAYVGANCKMFRLGEAILNYAEAAAQADHPEEAVDAVNEIRRRAGMPELSKSLRGEELILRIRNERRVELALEGFRYYDVRRWSKPTDDLSTTDRYITAIRVTRNVDAAGNFTHYSYRRQLVGERLCYTNKYLWLPLPMDEANLMETLTGNKWQNPGW